MENDKYIGRLLGGRYELIDVVGVGGMAVVYRARDTILGRYVAIKILKEEFAKDPDIRKRFSCIITILWTKRACAARRERPSAGVLRCRRSAGR